MLDAAAKFLQRIAGRVAATSIVECALLTAVERGRLKDGRGRCGMRRACAILSACAGRITVHRVAEARKLRREREPSAAATTTTTTTAAASAAVTASAAATAIT